MKGIKGIVGEKVGHATVIGSRKLKVPRETGAKRPKGTREPSKLEGKFDAMWAIFGTGERPVPEYRFHPERKWRFDRAWPGKMVAVELDGGVHTGGRHTRGKGFDGDCDKLNEAARMGWTVLRFSATHLSKRRQVATVDQIKAALSAQEAD